MGNQRETLYSNSSTFYSSRSLILNRLPGVGPMWFLSAGHGGRKGRGLVNGMSVIRVGWGGGGWALCRRVPSLAAL